MNIIDNRIKNKKVPLESISVGTAFSLTSYGDDIFMKIENIDNYANIINLKNGTCSHFKSNTPVIVLEADIIIKGEK